MRKVLLVTAGVALLLSGCHHRKAATAPPPPPPPPAAPTAAPPAAPPPTAPEVPPTVTAPPAWETGIASWYGYPFHGRRAANGEIYDMEQMTAAHRTLPFNTMVRVHDLDNEKTVDVRITDRGPFVDGRIIDLSHAAARALEMIGPGTARVQLEILTAPPLALEARYGVQVGAFRNRDSAEHLRQVMEAKYGHATLVQRNDTPGLWHVVVGREATIAGASALSARIVGENHGIIAAFVVLLDS